MRVIISYPLVWDVAVRVCPPLLPVRSGTASTLDLTDYKCLKTTSVSHTCIFWMCAECLPDMELLIFQKGAGRHTSFTKLAEK